MTSQQTVAVTCATGNQGRAVALALAKAGYQVRTLTRSPESAPAKSCYDGVSNVKLCKADYNDLESIKQAFQGVDIVFANTVPDFNELVATPGSDYKRSDLSEFEQGKRYADAAKAQGVKLLVWSTGFDGKKLSGGKVDIACLQDKIKVQNYIQEIGLHALFVECGWYFENIIHHTLAKIKDDGSIEFTWYRYSADDKVWPQTYVEADFGRAVCALIQSYSPQLKNKVVRLFERNFAVQELINSIAKATGRKVTYNREKFFKVENCDFDKLIALHAECYPKFTDIDPVLKAIEFKFTSLDAFVKEKLVPSLSL